MRISTIRIRRIMQKHVTSAASVLLGIGLGVGASLLCKDEVSHLISTVRNKSKYNFVLHVYEHCPFCNRTELILGWLGIPYERVVYGYGDVEGPTALTGKKMLPVLEFYEDGEQTYLPESLDIVNYINQLEGVQNAVLPPKSREDVEEWLSRYVEVLSFLYRPRVLKVPMKDFENEKDVKYTRQKYESKGFNYEEALEKTDEYLVQINSLLQEFDGMLYSSHSLSKYGRSLDDILVLPQLRTLSCVKGVKWPSKVLAYLRNGYKDCKAMLYFQYAS